MKFIHLTVKRFQFHTADSIYISKLGEQFSKILGDDYLLVVGNKNNEQFNEVNVINLQLHTWAKVGMIYFWTPYLYYFFWLPFFLILKIRKEENIFFSSDPNLLVILVFWKRILHLNLKICSDWHMLHNDWKDQFIAENSDKLITTSNKLMIQIIEKTPSSKRKILTVYGGVDLGKFKKIDVAHVRKEFCLPENKKIVAYVGLFKTMGMEKGINTMLKALTYLDDDIVMAFIGGKDDEITEYEGVAEKLGVLNRSYFVKKISDLDRVYSIEQAADALVIPYPDQPHFRLYGFPMKVYEYMASKRPIVYSRLELIEEMLSDCGFSFIPDDAQSLANTLYFVLSSENSEDVNKGIAAGYTKLTSLTWEDKAKKILEFLKTDE